jgi:hypothetical protein
METVQTTAPTRIKSTKQLASQRQIKAAIQHLLKQEFECAVTLAAAAEGLLPPTNDPHLFQDLRKELTPEEYREFNFNLVINWLKHYNPEDPDPVEISEFEAVITIERAITKFNAVYHQSSELMEYFLNLARQRYHSWGSGNSSVPDPDEAASPSSVAT